MIASMGEIANQSETFNMTSPFNVTSPLLNATSSDPEEEERRIARLNEIQIVRVVFLVIVTAIILVSIGKMIFQLLVRFAVKHDER